MVLAKKRNPFIAGFLTLFFGGTGFLYLGKLRWAIGYSILPLLVYMLVAWSRLFFSSVGIYAYLLFLFLASLFVLSAIIVAVSIAHRQQPQPLHKFQRWYYYILYAILTGFISNTVVEHREKLLGFATFNTPSLAMDKTLVLGDYFISDTWKYKNHLPKRGEVFVFKYPLKPEINYIKRLIGLPNDRIRIENNKVYVNGTLLNESYLNPENNLGRGLPDATYVVPENQLFVLGDNRDNSADSRDWGYVPKGSIVGSAEYIWFSYSSIDGLKTDRIGQMIK